MYRVEKYGESEKKIEKKLDLPNKLDAYQTNEMPTIQIRCLPHKLDACHTNAW